MRGQATPPHPSIYQVPLENLTFHYINPAKQWNYIEMHAASIGENTTPKSKNLRVHWNTVMLNLSTTATLWTEESRRCSEVASVEKFKQESMYGLCRQKSGHCREVAISGVWTVMIILRVWLTIVRNKHFTFNSNRDLHFWNKFLFFLSFFFSLLNINATLSNKVSIFRHCSFFLGNVDIFSLFSPRLWFAIPTCMSNFLFSEKSLLCIVWSPALQLLWIKMLSSKQATVSNSLYYFYIHS